MQWGHAQVCNLVSWPICYLCKIGNMNISTDGIDICDWEVDPKYTEESLPAPDDRLVFSCWDFAGQEVG